MGGEPINSVSKLVAAARSVSISMPNELLIRPPVTDTAWTSYKGVSRTRFAVSNTESGAKLITAKPCGTRSPTRRMATSLPPQDTQDRTCKSCQWARSLVSACSLRHRVLRMLQRKLAPAGNPINFDEVVTSAWGHRLKCSKRGKLFRCLSDSFRELVHGGLEASG